MGDEAISTDPVPDAAVDRSDAASKLPPSTVYLWAMLLARLYEVFPLICPHCGGDLKIVAFLTGPDPIVRILDHLGEPTTPPHVANDNPIPNGIYNNERGFTHDYYSGTTALRDDPTRCLGITPDAWALGGPVSHSGNISTNNVDIDIKPGSDPNAINPRSRGVIPVAILTTESFDATTVDPDTVAFGPSGAVIGQRSVSMEDVDGDADLDLVLHFRTQKTGIACGDTEASLSGATFEGTPIGGSDSIVTVSCE